MRPFFATAALWFAVAAGSFAAEAELVGLLAVAIEPEVATELRLTEEQQQSLQDLADGREMKGMSRAMKYARLPREERLPKLAEFRAESERLALRLLDETQVARLRELVAQRDDPALKPSEATPETSAPAPEAGPTEAVEAPPVDASPPPAAAPQPMAPSEPAARPTDGRLSFNFEQQPWGDVIRWFADRADLSVIVDAIPPGSLTYRDDRRYTPGEALDVLNGVLLTKGYTLVRKDRMLLVIDLEQDVIPPNVVTDVPLEELPSRGQYELIRVLFELGDVDVTAAADSLQRLIGPQGALVVLPEARMLQVTETAGRIRTMQTVIEALGRAAAPMASSAAELRSYPTGGADSETTLSILQTLLEGSPTARLAIDDQTASLIALATPAEHDAIRQTLDKLQTDGRRVELIRVDKVDAMVAASIVTKLFDPNAGDEKRRDPNAPVIEADRYANALLVRGSAAQVEQIRDVVERLDAPEAETEATARGTIRTLPLSQAELGEALSRIETVWPSLRSNPLRMATPTRDIPSFRPGAEVEQEQQADPLDLLFEQERPDGSGGPDAEAASTGRTTSIDRRSPFRFANQPAEGPNDEENTPTATADPVFISPSVGSTVIASRDTEALDLLERLLATVIEADAVGGRQYAVFYLKFSEATTAAALLDSIFGGEGGGGGGLMGDLAGAAIGGAGGDLLGDLLGGGGGGTDSLGFDSVSVDIVPDVRLNALYVHATPDDLSTINRLLRVIDQPRGPDPIESTGKSRLIRVENAELEAVAGVVRQVFADRLGSSGGGQPNPQDLIRALTGNQDGVQEQEPERMTLSVDERTSSLVVRSSEPLFEEVRSLVEQLDRPGVEEPIATRVVSLRNTGSEALLQTLTSMLGDKAVIGGAEPAAPRNGDAARAKSNETKPSGEEAQQKAAEEARDARRNLERFRRAVERFREQGGGGQRGGGQRGGGGRGGQGGGGPRGR